MGGRCEIRRLYPGRAISRLALVLLSHRTRVEATGGDAGAADARARRFIAHSTQGPLPCPLLFESEPQSRRPEYWEREWCARLRSRTRAGDDSAGGREHRRALCSADPAVAVHPCFARPDRFA